MGGLLSTPAPSTTRYSTTNTISTSSNGYRQSNEHQIRNFNSYFSENFDVNYHRQTLNRNDSSVPKTFERSFANLSLNEQHTSTANNTYVRKAAVPARQRKYPKAYSIQKQPTLLLTYLDEPFNYWSSSRVPRNASFEMTEMDMDETEARMVAQRFNNTNALFRILTIERIENPYLWACYNIKKAELQLRHGKKIEERWLFHGTQAKNIDKIADHNLNWRLCGSAKGHRFGQGVSFSPISKYSSHSCDEDACDLSSEMLLVKVLVTNICIGSKNMVIPCAEFDTSKKPGGHVIVKYEDNTFYPAYKIIFCSKEDYEEYSDEEDDCY